MSHLKNNNLITIHLNNYSKTKTVAKAKIIVYNLNKSKMFKILIMMTAILVIWKIMQINFINNLAK